MQRDLLPLVEGTTVATKYGPVKTDHILFIASGAFHVSKPSDLLPELQGRLPIRVELRALTEEDFRRILTETEASLIKQYKALMATEGVTLDFTDDAIDAIARIAVEVNSSVENIGARRLQTVMERILDEISFTATDRAGETVDDRRRLCGGAYRRPRAERRSEPVHPVGKLRGSCQSSSCPALNLPLEGRSRFASRKRSKSREAGDVHGLSPSRNSSPRFARLNEFRPPLKGRLRQALRHQFAGPSRSLFSLSSSATAWAA